MSSYGLLGSNPSGGVQISADYKSHSLWRSGYVTQGEFYNHGFMFACHTKKKVDITGLKGVVVFFGAESALNRITTFTWSEGGRVYLDFSKWWNLALTAPVSFYIFAAWDNPSRDSYGMRMEKNGEVMYDTSWITMDVRKVIRIPENVPQFIPGSSAAMYTASAGLPAGTYSVAVTSLRQYAYPVAGNGGRWLTAYAECVWLSGGSVNISFVPVPTPYGPVGGCGGVQESFWINHLINNLLIADISNLPIPFTGA